MKSMSKDALGDRMKMYERMEAGRKFMPGLPVYARLDGKCFHNFTKGLQRPFDEQMRNTMTTVTELLVDETNAVFGYTQSDEISLLFYAKEYKSQIYMDGRIQKMTSLLAALCTAEFNDIARGIWPEKFLPGKNLPLFDCRVFQLPSKVEAMNAILWRVNDSVKNSVSMAASNYYTHQQLDGKSESERQNMLMDRGINWNDYPAIYKEGAFVQRRKTLRMLTDKELAGIPEQHRPTGPVERSKVVVLDLPRFGSITNKVDLIFEGADPETLSEEIVEAGC
jgi:tRNA(His) 5'-end guanylyltransferase